jgi:hypothetical protein
LVTGDIGGAVRAWTIVEGAAITGAAYLLQRGRIRRRAPEPPANH